MSYAVRVIYAERRGKRGKRDLVKGFPTAEAARSYALKTAARGGSVGEYTERKPTACVYDLSRWKTPPECYRYAKATGASGERIRGTMRVREVPYTGLSGYSRFHRRHRRASRRSKRR